MCVVKVYNGEKERSKGKEKQWSKKGTLWFDGREENIQEGVVKKRF